MKKIKKRRKKILPIILLIIVLLMIIGSIKGWNMLKENKQQKPKENKIIDNKKEEEASKTLEKAPNTYQEFQNLKDGEYVTTNGKTLTIKEGIAYVDNHIIVNKTYAVPNNYTPEDPYEQVTTERCNNCINKDAMEAFKLMKSDAQSIGLNIYISSGYRSYSYQDKIYNNYVSVSGQINADTYSARPGHSEHQTGTCFDLNTIDDSFANTAEGKWINENAYIYGFIIRYPKGKETITGYQYESWHLRYVGKELAKELYQNNEWKTLEEYYGITSSYE